MNLRIAKLRSHGGNLRINYIMRNIGIAMNNRNIEAGSISVIRWRTQMSPFPYYIGDLKDDMKRPQ